MNKYQKSEKHLNNARVAQKKALETLQQLTKKRIDEYYVNPKCCLNCNNAIKYEKKANKFCSSKCSALYSVPTKGKERTLDVRSKISKSLGGTGIVNEKTKKKNARPNRMPGEENLTLSQIRSKRMKQYYIDNPEAKKRISEQSKNRICTPETRIKLKKMMAIRIADGKHKGWSKRNNPSFAELFFMKVLDNNNIVYEFEKKVEKYFIDFAINNKMIALEIDGKQHNWPDRKLKDEEKDKFLTEQNWKVYRIKWKNIRNPEGSDYIKNEIKKFVEFFNSLN